jgi:choice-of-anchor A domain-containing protein
MVAMIFAAATQGRAQTYLAEMSGFEQLARNYNAVVFNNATFNNYGDTWGPLAVGGNLSLNGGAVAIKPDLFTPSGDPTLYVNGQLLLSNDVHLNSGYASTPNVTGSWTFSNDNQRKFSNGSGKLYSANSSDPQANTSPIDNPAPANWNWASIQSTATSLSESLAAVAASGTISVNGSQTLVFSPSSTNAGTVVFNLDASLLGSGTYNGQHFSNLQFNMGSDQNFAINVLNANGRTLFGQGVNFNNPGNADRLLWNLSGSGSVNLGNGGQFYGSVLAPQMNVSNSNNASINGQIIVGGLSYSNAELHYTDFSPIGVLVPEPSTYAMWTLVCCGAALWWHRRRAAARG